MKLIIPVILIAYRLFGEVWYGDNRTYEWEHYNIMLWNVLESPEERAVYVNVNDFGIEYPVNLKAVSTYLWQAGKPFSFRIYAKDGTSLLYQSADSISIINYNDVYLDSVLVMNEDFWISLVPDSTGSPWSITDRYDTADPHTYTGPPGSWTPYIKEISTRFLIEQYAGTDIYPPSVRYVNGTSGYRETDLELSVKVQDQSGTISPAEGAYSLNGGQSWETFYVSSSKATDYFRGTIPAQPHGTSGLVKFRFEDTLNNSAWSIEYPLSWSKDNYLFSESFEDEFLPYLWTEDNTGAGFIRSQAASYSGKYSLAHLNDAGSQDDRLISPKIHIPDSVSAVLEFFQKDSLSAYSNGIHEVSVSVDKLNWSVLRQGSADYVFSALKLPLSAYSGQDIYFSFRYTGNSSDVWFVDDIKVICDDEDPFISDIYANTALIPDIGAYLNNDMEIRAVLSSRVGISSLKGYWSFDGGTTLDSTVFEYSEIYSVWAGTIPARGSVSAGTIYFDITDAGERTVRTGTYAIVFVEDTTAPSITAVRGRTALINKEAKISVTVNDESLIKSCRGHYSTNAFIDQYDFDLNMPKMNTYVYEGLIPAETAETAAELKFTIEDTEGNIHVSSEYPMSWISAPPDSFDLRVSYPENYVTSVKYQLGGTCWAHGTMSSAESSLLMTGKWGHYGEDGEPDLAEYHLDWWNGFNQHNNDDTDPVTGGGLVVHEGGDYLVAAAYFSRGEGAVRDIDGQSYTYPPQRASGAYHYYYPRSIEFYSAGDDLSNISEIKEKIMTAGALATCMTSNAGFTTDFIHYQPPSSELEPNHSIAIVGWNDSLVTQAPEGKGAWLCKNSYGSAWGLDGYFWISYYDKYAAKHPFMGAVSFRDVEMMKYGNVYSHDYHGWRETLSGINEVFNKFTAESNGNIEAVSFFTAADSVFYDVRIYDGFLNDSLQNELSSVTGTAFNKGFHTVDLTDTVFFESGNDFYVYLSLSSGGQPIDTTSDIPTLLGGGSKALVQSKASADESYYFDGGEWKDLYLYSSLTYPGTANFCVKALGNTLKAPSNVIISTSGTAVVISWNAAPGAVSYRIEASLDPYGTYTDVSSQGTFEGMSWTGPAAGYMYYYRVVAVY
ncbi:MAG: lectin like domain-containing protein [Candidatus Delongbacteria bacterium]